MLKRRLPRRVWMFWEQGAAAAPEIVRECLAAWPRLNPGWQVRVLDGDSARRAAPRYARLVKRCARSDPTKRSDLLRLELLARHGGVWADATVMPLRPLDEWLPGWLRPAGFFAFRHHPERAREVGRIAAAWFMAALPKNPLVVAWRDDFRRVWQCIPEGGGSADDFVDYFIINQVMLCTVAANPAARRVWNTMPVVIKNQVREKTAALENPETARLLMEEWKLPVLKCNTGFAPRHIAMAREIGLFPAAPAAG